MTQTIVAMPCRQVARYFDVVPRALYRLDPQPDLYVFSEDNSTDETLQLIEQFERPKKIIRLQFPENAVRTGCLPTRNNPGDELDTIAAIRQVLLQVVRRMDPDFMIYLDSDICVRSHDLIPRLTRWMEKADIIGGPFRFLCPLGSIFYTNNLNWMATATRPRSWPWRELEEVMFVGGGCMCLPRRVIQDSRLNFYPWRQDDLPLDVEWLEDSGYCLHARKLGYTIALDWSVFLDHWFDTRSKPWRTWKGIENGVGTWLIGD